MTKLEVHVRRGSLEDAVQAWRPFQNHLNWANVWYDPSQVIQRRMSVEFFEHLFRNYPSAVAVADDVIIGSAVCEARELGVLELTNIYVDDSFRQQGVGGALLREVEGQCHSLGFSTIIGFASTQYFPGKQLPTGAFKRADYEIRELSSHAQMYLRAIPLTEAEEQIFLPVRQLALQMQAERSGHRLVTIDDLNDETDGTGRTILVENRIDLDEPTERPATSTTSNKEK